jgi:hypothetical protein
VEPAQAEAITRVMSEMIDQLATSMGQLYVCKMELEKVSCHRPHSLPRIRTARCRGVAILAHTTAHSDQRSCRSNASRFWWLTGSVEGCGGLCVWRRAHQANIKHGSALELYKHDLNQTHENDVAKMKREIDRLKVECEKLRAELR